MPHIFERPDGGNTVYSRKFGSSDRQLISVSLREQEIRDSLLETALWEDIRTSAKSNQALQEALDRVKILYYLSKKDGNKET